MMMIIVVVVVYRASTKPKVTDRKPPNKHVSELNIWLWFYMQSNHTILTVAAICILFSLCTLYNIQLNCILFIHIQWNLWFSCVEQFFTYHQLLYCNNTELTCTSVHETVPFDVDRHYMLRELYTGTASYSCFLWVMASESTLNS